MVTEIEPVRNYSYAEEYHQQVGLRRAPAAEYCLPLLLHPPPPLPQPSPSLPLILLPVYTLPLLLPPLPTRKRLPAWSSCFRSTWPREGATGRRRVPPRAAQVGGQAVGKGDWGWSGEGSHRYSSNCGRPCTKGSFTTLHAPPLCRSHPLLRLTSKALLAAASWRWSSSHACTGRRQRGRGLAPI